MRDCKKSLPDFLYKYGSLEPPKRLKHLKEILHDNKIWFSDPKSLNDPFEFQPIVSMGNSLGEKEKFKKWLQNLFSKRGADKRQSKRSASDVIQKCRKNPSYLKETLSKYLKNNGLYCLTEDPKSLLMWSYYTNGHTGYCLKFSTRINSPFSGARPINYSVLYPVVTTYNGDPEKWGIDSVLTKSIQWKHECEWRLFNSEQGHIDFAPEYLIGIILGCNVKPSHRELIEEWCSEREIPIQVSYATKDNKEYKINIVATKRG